MAVRKCPGCGATLKGGTLYCEYCGTDWSPPKPDPSLPQQAALPRVQPVKPRGAGKTVIFVILLLFCPPGALVFMWAAMPWRRVAKIAWTAALVGFYMTVVIWGVYHDAVYLVHADTPKFSAEPLPTQNRPAEQIEAADIYRQMRNLEGQELEKRKQLWIKTYQGRWVQWEGEVEQRYTYTSSPSKLIIRPEKKTPYRIEAFFDPIYNKKLDQIDRKDRVTISGMLWGYDISGDDVMLADSAIMAVSKHKPVEEETTP